MPNPLTRQGNPNKSKGRPEAHPEALEPILESVLDDDWNNAYRGIVDHGVDPTHKFSDVPQLDGTPDEEYEDEDKEEHVTPVRIVQESSNEHNYFRVSTTYAERNGAMIVNAHEKRTSVVIRNVGIAPIYISDRLDLANNVDGWRLNQMQEMTLKTDQPVYAGCATNDREKVMTLHEYTT